MANQFLIQRLKSPWGIVIPILLIVVAFVCVSFSSSQTKLRRLSTLITSPYISHKGDTMPYDLPQAAADFCFESSFPPLDFHDCNETLPFYRVKVFGGYTNMMKLAIMSAITAYEDNNRCFFLDDKDAQLKTGEGSNHPTMSKRGSVLDRYIETIGLPRYGPMVKKAIKEGNVQDLDWEEIWGNLDRRRIRGSSNTIETLGFKDVEGHRLKMIMLMKLWRPLPKIRHEACQRVEQYDLKDDYIALSLRRGDKNDVEEWVFASLDQYIEAVEGVVGMHVFEKMPKIFVATDDCRVMEELRIIRPEWKFVSECDKPEHKKDHGFFLQEAKKWNEDELDRHFAKFFTELYAMAFAKYWIGVKYTNVSWFVYFMRRANVNALHFLETPGKAETINTQYWR